LGVVDAFVSRLPVVVVVVTVPVHRLLVVENTR